MKFFWSKKLKNLAKFINQNLYISSTATSLHLEELQELRFGVGQREDVFIIGHVGSTAQLPIQHRCEAK